MAPRRGTPSFWTPAWCPGQASFWIPSWCLGSPSFWAPSWCLGPAPFWPLPCLSSAHSHSQQHAFVSTGYHHAASLCWPNTDAATVHGPCASAPTKYGTSIHAAGCPHAQHAAASSSDAYIPAAAAAAAAAAVHDASAAFCSARHG